MIKDIKILDRVIGCCPTRDYAIIDLYAEGYKEEEIAKMFNLTVGRISQIIKPNRVLCDELTIQKAMAKKARRLRVADRNIRAKDGRSKKDILDWLEYERKEIEGEKGTTIHNEVNIATGLKGKELERRNQRISRLDRLLKE